MNKIELEALLEELDEALVKAFPGPEPLRGYSDDLSLQNTDISHGLRGTRIGQRRLSRSYRKFHEDLRRRRMEVLAALPPKEREAYLVNHRAKMAGKPRVHIVA